MHLSSYLKYYPVQNSADRFLLYSTLRSATVLVSGTALRAAQEGCVPEAEGETLRRLGMLVEDPGAEKERIRSLLQRADGNARSFKATVVLNLDCNLDCGYCFEGEFRGNHYMSEGTAQLLVDYLIRERMSAGMDIRLTFYGGEPLLSQDLIRKISEPLLEAAKRHGVNYGFTLVTNGTLLNRQTAKRLIPLGLKGAKFTLDGPREIHDGQRPFASGSGSFDAIVDNVAEVWDIVQIQLGGNFYQENYRDFPRLFDQLIERGITPEKIEKVKFTPITPKAGCSEYSAGCSCSSDPWLFEALPFLQGEILARGFATTRLKASACIVELSDNFVVNYDGSLYKCPAFMGYEGLSIGTLADGVGDYAASHGIGNWKNEQCLDCAYLPLCFGGCRFLNLLQKKELAALDCKRDFLDANLETMILQELSRPRRKTAAAAAPARATDC